MGKNTWAAWTGDIQTDVYGQFYIDALNSAPMQDRLLFDVFTAQLNGNAVLGALPVNVAADPQNSAAGLAAWSALFSGMVVLTNNNPRPLPNAAAGYTNVIIDPAGVNQASSPLMRLVNSINATRNLFPNKTFTHAGDVLQAPALSEQSPFLTWNDPTGFQQKYGISDELYEWLPQHMMGLVRLGETRYVVYAYGQALQPAPGGEVLGGPFFQMITNYQVVAESAVRAVIRVDPHVTPTGTTYTPVVESYNVLPPN